MTIKLNRRPDTDSPVYDVVLDGEVVGAAYAPDRACGETEWTGRVVGQTRSIRAGSTTRKEVVDRIVAHHRRNRG
jgi:hypothetical protein